MVFLFVEWALLPVSNVASASREIMGTLGADPMLSTKTDATHADRIAGEA